MRLGEIRLPLNMATTALASGANSVNYGQCADGGKSVSEVSGRHVFVNKAMRSLVNAT